MEIRQDHRRDRAPERGGPSSDRGANRPARPRNRANAAPGAPEPPGKSGCETSMVGKPSRGRSNRCPPMPTDAPCAPRPRRPIGRISNRREDAAGEFPPLFQTQPDPAQLGSDTAPPRHASLQRGLYRMQVSFIGSVFAFLAALSRRTTSTEATVNRRTAVLAGIATGRLLFGFPVFHWLALLLWSWPGGLIFSPVRAGRISVFQVNSASAARSVRRRSWYAFHL